MVKKVETIQSELNQHKLLLLQLLKNVSNSNNLSSCKLPPLPVNNDEMLNEWEEFLKEDENILFAVS